MKFPIAGLSIALLSSVAVTAFAAEADPIVQVTGGQIKGRLIPAGGAVFKGVPFAQPPVGDLRWRDPAPVKSWTGVRDAADYGPPCTQQIPRNEQQTVSSQEDCLTLNMWTGEWPSRSPKPVMVWLYGGGNTAGLTSVGYLDGTSLSRRGVILITVNYRVGIMGFLALPGLTAESPRHASGNYGLLDQLAALKWVHENISRFGGDPTRVTLFGQSAGGIDTAYLVSSPSSKGLIRYAIQESGSPIHPMGSLAEAEQLGVKLAESLNAPATPAEAVKFLRAMPGPELQKAAVAKMGQDNFIMFPLIDGHFIPKHPALVYKEGNEAPIPTITGSNLREEPRNYNVEDMKRVVAANFGPLAPKAEEFYSLANGGTGKDDPIYGTTLAQIPTDTKHRCGAVAESIWRNSHGRTTYQYQFDVPIAGETITRHTAEIPFVFGNLQPKGVPMGGPYTEADRKVSDTIQTYWTNFARTGNPNGNGLPEWPKSDTRLPYLEFTIHDGPVVGHELRKDICGLYIEGLKGTIPGNTAGSR